MTYIVEYEGVRRRADTWDEVVEFTRDRQKTVDVYVVNDPHVYYITTLHPTGEQTRKTVWRVMRYARTRDFADEDRARQYCARNTDVKVVFKQHDGHILETLTPRDILAETEFAIWLSTGMVFVKTSPARCTTTGLYVHMGETSIPAEFVDRIVRIHDDFTIYSR